MSRGLYDLDVLIIVSSDPRYDTRSTKFLKALTEAGYSAKVVGVCIDGERDNARGILRMPVHATSGKLFFVEFYQNVVPVALKISPRLVIAGDLFSLPPAIICKQRHKHKSAPVRLVYDSKELYEELPSLKRKKSSFIFWNMVEKTSIRYVDAAFTVNRSIADILEPKWDLPFTVVRNVPDKTDSPLPSGSLERIILTFSGGLQPGRGLKNLIKLMTLLPEKYELRIVGDGLLREELARLSRTLKVHQRVHFTGRVRSEEVIPELAKAHIGIYLMENTGLCHFLALPNKFFQFISARLPVIVPKFPEMERIVNDYQIGRAVDPLDLDETARTVLSLTEDPQLYATLKSNCEKAAGELNWEVEKDKFLETVAGLV